jgi:hypothetical protein
MSNLRKAVINQLGGLEIFKQSFKDITRHGADSGFNGFIYYTDTTAFFKRNRRSILAHLDAICFDIGEDRISVLKSWRCLNHLTSDEIARGLYEGGKSDEVTAVQNALAFFALEEVAHDEERREEENAEPLELTSYNYATN